MPAGWLENKKIVIIGGTTGIGLSAARLCIHEGAMVVVVGIDALESKSAENTLGPQAVSITADANSPSTAAMAIELCIERFGGMDGLYHVAGGSGRKFGDGPLHEMQDDGWQKTLHWNLDSLMYSNKAALQYFLSEKKPGVILNMSSVLGFSPSPHFFSTHAYASAKAAAIGLSKSLAAYYASFQVRVNVIAPGLIDTAMSKRAVSEQEIMEFISTKQPLDGGRAGLPDDLAGTAVFLLSDRAAFITGQVISVDGGWALSDGQYGEAKKSGNNK
jgi:NAD(P)-dependent dehydrogenase (short-subunit alcohol dehydrogenase family)